jgi:hypothetical protein
MGQYVHCATCGRAYDARACTRCPSCRPSVEARVAAALEEIASALAEARPDERVRVRAALESAPVLALTPRPRPPEPPPPLWRTVISAARAALRTRFQLAR